MKTVTVCSGYKIRPQRGNGSREKKLACEKVKWCELSSNCTQWYKIRSLWNYAMSKKCSKLNHFCPTTTTTTTTTTTATTISSTVSLCTGGTAATKLSICPTTTTTTTATTISSTVSLCTGGTAATKLSICPTTTTTTATTISSTVSFCTGGTVATKLSICPTTTTTTATTISSTVSFCTGGTVATKLSTLQVGHYTMIKYKKYLFCQTCKAHDIYKTANIFLYCNGIRVLYKDMTN